MFLSTDGEHFFVDDASKIHKVAPDGWKEGPKGHAPPVTFKLYVRIKFYPESLTDFRYILFILETEILTDIITWP